MKSRTHRPFTTPGPSPLEISPPLKHSSLSLSPEIGFPPTTSRSLSTWPYTCTVRHGQGSRPVPRVPWLNTPSCCSSLSSPSSRLPTVPLGKVLGSPGRRAGYMSRDSTGRDGTRHLVRCSIGHYQPCSCSGLTQARTGCITELRGRQRGSGQTCHVPDTFVSGVGDLDGYIDRPWARQWKIPPSHFLRLVPPEKQEM